MSFARSDKGFDDQVLQYLLIHIGEFLDVEATLPSFDLAQVSEKRFRIARSPQSIENGCGLARRKSDQHHVPFTPTFVPVMIAAEADDRGTPHPRLFARRVFHQLDEDPRVRMPDLIRQAIDEGSDAHFIGGGLVGGHSDNISATTAIPGANTTAPVKSGFRLSKGFCAGRVVLFR